MRLNFHVSPENHQPILNASIILQFLFSVHLISPSTNKPIQSASEYVVLRSHTEESVSELGYYEYGAMDSYVAHHESPADALKRSETHASSGHNDKHMEKHTRPLCRLGADSSADRPHAGQK
jgi:hypothetical protein